jgi:hypothetical protein
MSYMDAPSQEAVQVNQVFAAIASGDLDRALSLTESIFVQEPGPEARSDLEAEMGSLQDEVAAGGLLVDAASSDAATAAQSSGVPAEDQLRAEAEVEGAQVAGLQIAVGTDLLDMAQAHRSLLNAAETDSASPGAGVDPNPVAAAVADGRSVLARIAATPDPPAALEEPQAADAPFDLQLDPRRAPASRGRRLHKSERHPRRTAGTGSHAKNEGELRPPLGDVGVRAMESSLMQSPPQELAGLVEEPEIDGGDTTEAMRILCEQCDELKSKLTLVQSQLQEQKDRRRRIEEQRRSESIRYRQTIADLKARGAVLSAFTNAKERELAAVAAERDQERTRREGLVRLLAAFGLDDTTSSLNVLHGALEGLTRLSEGIEAYVEHEREREDEQARVSDAAELERAAAVRARRAQAEQEVAWATRELQRLEDMERELLPEG